LSKELTKRQGEILKFIEDYYNENNFPPTINEISKFFKISVKGSYDHIKALEKKKYLSYDPKKRRSFKLLYETESNKNFKKGNYLEISILGIVQAGLPILSYENYDTKIKVDKNLFGSGELFGLKVRGDSMLDAGIFEDDIAIVKNTQVFNNGEILVVETENGVTIKKAYKQKNFLRLEACNDDYPTIISRNPRIIGKLTGLIRKY